MKISNYIHSLVEGGIVPGISILVGKREKIRFKKQYGLKSIFPSNEKLEDAPPTLYDLASLTKPLVTAFLLVYLKEKEKIALDKQVKEILPQLPNEFDMTLLHLLTHTSGLPAWFPFYLFADKIDSDGYLAHFPLVKLESRPGRRVEYSCVGYILLYYVIEKIAGTSFKALAREVIFEPLGLKNTFLEVPEHLKKNTAPTEKGNEYERKLALDWARTYESGKYLERARQYKWREEVIQGEAHDVNSHHLGGTAGNAGLFSTMEDVFRLCQEFFPSTASLLNPESLRLFWKNFTPFKISHRTVGFKRNSSFITSGGRALSRAAIGHNGFTGTSLWLDPRKEMTFILLSNRVHPEYKAVNFDKIRRKLHRLLTREPEYRKGGRQEKQG
ncbi:MAG: serine hydrolase [Candidatus Aminicenantes bacterium]|nr:serine hydrolase [Candidatus Aminicenantes bacterium]NIM81620.1 serine hydrolase [Candidatus Aminicenantes bacterium]NIN20990.1 serine hydrolase [Candidatus Aminicenantes bacterium]NIN44811.1 serine hydrolase [Candidatus Aminicenantes bacterium]NIN87619.1 serine hydrolase [Candidatus Aminicenantes bacterium]